MIVALVLVSALLHATWNALVRLEPDKDAAVVVVVAIAGALAAIVAAIEVGAGVAPWPRGAALAWSLAAGVGETAYFAALARALASGPLGPTYTIARGGAVLLVWPVSIAIWGEPVEPIAIAGSAVLLIGLAVAGAQRGVARAAIGWGLACAVCVATYHSAYKAAISTSASAGPGATGASPSAVFAISLALATTINLARLGAERRAAVRARLRAAPVRLVVIGAICAAAFLLFMYGLRGGGAGYVLTLRNTSVLFATALGWWIGEPPRRAQLVGAALVAIGATLLALHP